MAGVLTIRNMTRGEVDELVDWAAREGWNPGLHDADAFWFTDPEAFVAAEAEGTVIGGGAITSYGGEYGFMGFFIVKPEFRGRGYGNELWHARRERLLRRLRPGASIGMDGVFAMQGYYAQGGFVFAQRDLRYSTVIPADYVAPATEEHLRPLGELTFDELACYDRTCFPAARDAFLRRWIATPDARALGCVRRGRLCGYGVVRRGRQGCKIGPLFADDAAAAEALFADLASHAAGGALCLDVPENNVAAMELARRHCMTEVFGCARMYLGPVPRIAHERVFGVTTFELG